VLLGIVLFALGLFMLLALLFAREVQQQDPASHPLSVLGYSLSHPLINFGLGRWWTLVLPLLLLQVSWRLLRERSLREAWPRWWRQALFALAGSLSHALLLVETFRTGSAAGAWEAGSLSVLVVGALGGLADWGVVILVAAFDLVVLALVFHLHPGRLLDGLAGAAAGFLRWLHSGFGEWRRRRKTRRTERRKAARRRQRERAAAEKRHREEEELGRQEERRRLAEDLARADAEGAQGKEREASVEGEEFEEAEQGDGAPADGPASGPDDEFEVSEEVVEREKRFKAKKRRGEFRYVPPPVDLLDDPPEDEYHVTEEDMQLSSQMLVACLGDFNVEARVVHVHPGPVITRYDLEPAPGVKVSRIAGLADDLALALRAERIRIIAPVPGKGTVGVELPNKVRNTVFMKSIVNTDKFVQASSPLTIALGKTSSGEAAVADLRSMPHILIAGQTGAGKSVCINSIICSILLRAMPTEVQFVLVDPKMIELSDYRRIAPHFLARMEGIEGDVVTNPQDAVKMLDGLQREMDRRYQYLSRTGYRSIREYNEAVASGEVSRRVEQGDLFIEDLEQAEGVAESMVYLVVIIDELADLMMTAGKDIETSIARLAQKARAVGIHLVVATQRPSVDVLTGLIKANFPARIAFAVRQKVDSKTIIDGIGADQLLGLGDMLYLASGTPEPARMHNCLITGREIRRLLDHIRRQSRNFHKFSLPIDQQEQRSFTEEASERDALFWDAAEQVIRSGQGSISVLQRRLRIGHSRASRLIDELEIAGVVGSFDGSKAREVLVDVDWLEEHREN